MYYHPATDRYIREGEAFDLVGLQFPGDWHSRISPQELEGLGLFPVPTVGNYEDPELYITTETYEAGQLVLVNTPRDPQALLNKLAETRAELIAKGKAVREQTLDRLMGLSGRAHRAGDTARWQTADAAAEALLLLFKFLPEGLPETVAEVQQRYAAIIEAVTLGDVTLLSAFEDFDL